MARRVMRYSSGQWPQHEGAIRVLEAYLAHAVLLVPLDELSAVMVAVMVEETVAEKVELETGVVMVAVMVVAMVVEMAVEASAVMARR